jgi:hypothetical protein
MVKVAAAAPYVKGPKRLRLSKDVANRSQVVTGTERSDRSRIARRMTADQTNGKVG